MERPYLPIANSHFCHIGVQSLIVDCISQQSALDLSLILPLWNCHAAEDTEDNESLWISLLRFLSSTTSFLQLHCLNRSTLSIQHFMSRSWIN